ncbi:MAG: hypothetical protein MI922_09700, partial [Bacteroidales bacterium]|nr:hypothetical protein [Bacteroidales bacterium]
KGFVADFVKRSINTETMDWTQFILSSSMDTSWNVPNNNLALETVSVDGDAIVASGQWNSNPDILASVRYTMLEDAPILKIVVTLTNESGADFDGYLEYQIDPDGSGNEYAYAPGIGWGGNVVRTSGWTANYIYDGPNYTSTLPAHGIAWYENTPSGVLVPG